MLAAGKSGFLVLVLVMLHHWAIAQTDSVRFFEYYFNNPKKTFTRVLANDSDALYSLNISSLKPGVHTLFYRFISDTIAFGPFKSTPFLIGNTPGGRVQQLEYAYDEVPGELPRTLEVNNNTIDTFALTAGTLNPGIHQLFYRFLDEKNQRGLLKSFPFLLLEEKSDRQLVYAIDEVPGDQSRVISDPNSDSTYTISLSGIGEGVHTLNYRFTNEQKGVVKKLNFVILPTNGEEAATILYAFNNVPVMGIDSMVNLAGPVDSVYRLLVNNDLSPGIQRIFYRIRDNEGNWGRLLQRTFFLRQGGRQRINRLEYFIDEDPGLGEATALEDVPFANNIQLERLIAIDTIGLGQHIFNVRARNAAGNWSVVQEDSFCIFAPQPLVEQQGDTLTARNSTGLFDWYRNDTLVSEATDSVIIATQAGTWRVESRVNQCAISSEPLEILVTGTDPLSVLEQRSTVFPNPASGYFTLKIYSAYTGRLEISIISPTGKLIRKPDVYHKRNRLFSRSLNLWGKPPGLYFIRVRSRAGVFTKPVIINR